MKSAVGGGSGCQGEINREKGAFLGLGGTRGFGVVWRESGCGSGSG